MKHTGDGIMAPFEEAVQAVGGRRGIQRAFAAFNIGGREKLRVGIGLYIGEPVADSNDLFGSTVQMAARPCQGAGPGGSAPCWGPRSADGVVAATARDCAIDGHQGGAGRRTLTPPKGSRLSWPGPPPVGATGECHGRGRCLHFRSNRAPR